jgi:hypothetical protein
MNRITCTLPRPLRQAPKCQDREWEEELTSKPMGSVLPTPPVRIPGEQDHSRHHHGVDAFAHARDIELQEQRPAEALKRILETRWLLKPRICESHPSSPTLADHATHPIRLSVCRGVPSHPRTRCNGRDSGQNRLCSAVGRQPSCKTSRRTEYFWLWRTRPRNTRSAFHRSGPRCPTRRIVASNSASDSFSPANKRSRGRSVLGQDAIL